LKDFISRNGTTSSWVEEAVSDNRNYATYSHELAATSSDPMFHTDENRWWVVLQGKIEWSIDGEDSVVAEAGDVVFVEQGKNYSISTISNDPSIRITIAAPVV